MVYCGYLEASDGKVETTECGKNILRSKVAGECGILRLYERTILEAIDNGDVIGVTAAIIAIDLMPVFTAEGLYDIEKSRGLICGAKKYLRTIKLERTLGEVLKERDAARHFNNQETDPLRIMESYAFPGLMRSEFFNPPGKLVGGEASQSPEPEILFPGGMAVIARNIFSASAEMANMMAGIQAQIRPLF